MIASVTLTVFTMVKAQKETVLQLRASEETNDAVNSFLDSEEFGYAIINEDGQIVEWNLALERITGWSSVELVGRSLELVMEPKMWQKHKLAFAKAMAAVKADKDRKTKTAVVQCSIPSRNGGVIEVQVTVRIIAGRHGHLYAIAHVDRERNIVEATLLPKE